MDSLQGGSLARRGLAARLGPAAKVNLLQVWTAAKSVPLQGLDSLQRYDLLQGLDPLQKPDLLQGLDSQQMSDMLQTLDPLQKSDPLQKLDPRWALGIPRNS